MGTSGQPVLLCKKSGKSKGKRSANLKKILKESQQERYGRDKDIDREIDNVYFGGFSSGGEVYDYMVSLADNHIVMGKGGKPRKMRSDATIGVAVISKPSVETFEEIKQMAVERSIDPDDLEEQFLSDLYDCNKAIYEKHGFQIVAGALHYDEQQPHYHFMLVDPDFRIGEKAKLPFFSDLNKTLPKMMRDRGWPIEDLDGYDRERAEAEPEYKRKHIKEKEKKKHGRSSAEYKADKDAEKKEKELQDQRQREIRAREFLTTKLKAANARAESLEEVAEERDFYRAKAEAEKAESEMLRELLRAEKRKPAKVIEKVVESPQVRQTIDKQQEVITAQEEQINRLEAKLEALTGMVRARKTIEEADEDLESDFEK